MKEIYYLYTVNPDLIYIPLKSKEKGRKKTLDFKQLKDKLDESQVLIEWGELEKIQKIRNDIEHKLIYAELSGDFPLGDSRQPTYKSLRPFDLVS